jgi:hypothetical protein
MARTTRFGLTGILVAAVVSGALVGACSSSSPVDIHLGTDLGADFRAPVTDAASDTAVDGPDAAGGAGDLAGAGGLGGAAGTGGAGGQAGTGAAGAAGSGGAGTGS